MQAEILDEQGRDGRGTGVAGKLRQAGGAGPLPMLFASARLSPRHRSLGAGREMGRSPCHARPVCSVAQPACTPVPRGLLGRFPAKDGPAALALGKFIPLALFALFARKLVCS